MRRLTLLAALAATALFAGAASSAPAPLTGFETAVPALQTSAPFVGELAPQVLAVRYRERGGYRRSRASYSSPGQLHAGFFEPDGKGSTAFVLGLRGGPLVDPHVQIGAGVDWHHKSEKTRTVTGDPYTQGGTTIFPERVLSRASSDLLPIYGFLQVSGDENAPVIPYGGVSGGYQVLFLTADDYVTQANYDATFGGWMWEAWGGIALPLSGQTRLTGEVFVHQGDADREVEDLTGFTYRERVNLDGVGMRFGLSWGF